jgi:formamidopyrimidine-DNA glycosylase
MPELPEVETTRRGIEPHVLGHRLARVLVHEKRLRWPVSGALAGWAQGQEIKAVDRRGKYLLLRLERGYLLLHLGMSGSLRVMPAITPRIAHDHVDLELSTGQTLRFNDPRRFGSLHHGEADPLDHPLLRNLAPEPLLGAFDAEYLYRVTRGRRVAIKQAVMNSQLVVGVGNIYASEALFRARIRPGRAAKSLTHVQCKALVGAIRAVLNMAIRFGGTTLRDYVGAEGKPGYFQQRLYVYERDGMPCRRCRTLIRHRNQGARSTYFCPTCQS